jgi:hypothetical protein
MKNLIPKIILTMCLILTSCSPSTDAIQTAIAQTQSVKVEKVVSTATLNPVQTSIPLIAPTPLSTQTVSPTQTALHEPASENKSGMIAINNITKWDAKGLLVEILRLEFVDQKTINRPDLKRFEKKGDFEGKDVYGIMYFKLTNNTDQKVNFSLTGGTAVVNNEQVNLAIHTSSGEFGDTRGLYHGIFPGVTMTGGVLFGLKRVKLQDIQKFSLSMKAPYNSDAPYEPLSNQPLEVNLVIDGAKYDPLQPELLGLIGQ